MVYIVGVNHLVQYNGPVPEKLRTEFEQNLADLINKLKIKLLAEEFSEESLRDVYGASECTCRNAAVSCGIEHRFCDPEERERDRLGIPYYFDIRESVKRKYNISDKIISDINLKKKVEDEARAVAKSFWEARERFWVERIADRINENILFVCGHEHTDRLLNLLNDMGCPAEIIDPFWRREIFCNYENIGLS